MDSDCPGSWNDVMLTADMLYIMCAILKTVDQVLIYIFQSSKLP